MPGKCFPGGIPSWYITSFEFVSWLKCRASWIFESYFTDKPKLFGIFLIENKLIFSFSEGVYRTNLVLKYNFKKGSTEANSSPVAIHEDTHATQMLWLGWGVWCQLGIWVSLYDFIAFYRHLVISLPNPHSHWWRMLFAVHNERLPVLSYSCMCVP